MVMFFCGETVALHCNVEETKPFGTMGTMGGAELGAEVGTGSETSGMLKVSFMIWVLGCGRVTMKSLPSTMETGLAI